MKISLYCFAVCFLTVFSTTYGKQNHFSQSSCPSVYTVPLNDTHAAYLTPEQFDVTPNAEGDDSDALTAPQKRKVIRFFRYT